MSSGFGEWAAGEQRRRQSAPGQEPGGIGSWFEEERRQREERERLAARQERERRKRLAKELQEQRRRAAALARQRYGARRWLAAGSWLALPYIGITLACTTETSSGGRRRHAGRPSRRYVAWGTGGNSTSRRASVLPL